MADRLLVATRKGLFFYRGGGTDWHIDHVAFLGEPVSMCLADPRDGAIYAGLALGHFGVKLHRSDDGGQTWTELAPPVYPEKPDDAADSNPWSLSMIWSLEPGEPGVLWAGTIPGGLFRSDDRGVSWDLQRSLWDRPERKGWFGGGADHPGVHSVCIDQRDRAVVTLGISCGGVWRSLDSGQSWQLSAKGMVAGYMPPELAGEENTQDPHRVVQSPSHPDVFWASHHNGVFRSTDAAATWHAIDVPPSSFGFAVAVHPHDADTAWFVPATADVCRLPVDGKVVVSRTRDGGQTFDVLTDGLPQEHAYDLAFRHCLDVDASGDGLAFGSTTGSLWITGDGGDHWTTLSEHLPPIYCVRFG